MSKVISISGLVLICVAGWKIGGMLSTDALALVLGVIFGMMAGIPAALIAVAASNRTQEPMTHRVDSHRVAEQPIQTTALTVQPERWFIVEPTVLILPSATHERLEVLR